MGTIPVSFTGVMWYPDLSVGGGPMPGGPPLGFWGGYRPPYVDISPPGQQPGIWPSPGVPTHPIYYPPHPSHPIYNPGGPPGSSPPGYWGGGMGPGVPPQPGIWPNPPEGQAPIPSHPIYFPPPGSPPPLGIWGGPFDPPHPAHPIVLPPNLPPEIPPPDGGGSPIPIDWKVAWTPTTGWVVIGVPTGAHPAPSATPPAK